VPADPSPIKEGNETPPVSILEDDDAAIGDAAVDPPTDEGTLKISIFVA